MSQEALPVPENFSRVEDFRVLMALPRLYRVTIAYERLMKTATTGPPRSTPCTPARSIITSWGNLGYHPDSCNLGPIKNAPFIFTLWNASYGPRSLFT
jgi:hypothetical protein